MGDVAMIVPVLKVFNKTYPEIHLTVLSRSFFKPLFEDLENITFLEADLEDKCKLQTGSADQGDQIGCPLHSTSIRASPGICTRRPSTQPQGLRNKRRGRSN